MLVRAVPADPTPFSLVRGQNVVRVAEVSLRNHRGDNGVVRLHSHSRLWVGLVGRKLGFTGGVDAYRRLHLRIKRSGYEPDEKGHNNVDRG